jgi:hypothetical protein
MQREIARRGALAAVNEVELMGGGYAGYADMMAAPAWHVARTHLVLAGKMAADQVIADDMDDAGGTASSAGSGGGGGGSRGQTRVSAYYPHDNGLS